MGAIRRKFSTNFTMVHNEYLNDSRLSGSEMGWLTYMLSRPDNWNFSIEGLAHTHSDGKTRIMTTLNKLKSFGYFRRIKLVDSKTGRIVDWVYEFSDEVQPEWIEAEDACEVCEEPHSDFPDVENQPQSSTDIISTDIDVIDDLDCTDCANDDAKTEEISEQEFINYNSAIKAQIDYDRLCAECNKYDVDRIKDIILDVMLCKASSVIIGREEIPIDELKEMFGRIEYSHIKKLCELIIGKKIRNFRNYIRKSLFNAISNKKLKKPTEFKSYDNETLLLYADACDNKFNNEQMEYIENRLLSIIPYCTGKVDKNDVELERYEFLRMLYLRMKAESSQKKISNKFKYFCVMLENEKYTPYTSASQNEEKDPYDMIIEQAMKSDIVL